MVQLFISELSSYAVGKMLDGIADQVEKKRKEKELLQKYDEFCKDSRWRDTFENQGFQEGIDFTALTESLKKNIAENAYDYYHSLHAQFTDQQLEHALQGLNQIALAETESQHKQVRAIVTAAYHMVFAFYCENLDSNTRFVMNALERVTAELKSEIAQIMRNGVDKLDLLDSHIPPTPTFVGRHEDLQKIDQRFSAGQHTVVLCGQGGMGKSELAKKYAEAHRGDYAMVCFAYYAGSIRDTVASSLSWGGSAWKQQTINEQLRLKFTCLQKQQKRVLLIFDNVNQLEPSDHEALATISNPNIHILLTTRAELLIDTLSIKVESLVYPEDLLPLFKKQAQIRDTSWLAEKEPVIGEIIQDILQKHTMLTVLTAKLLHATDKTIEEIRDTLRSNRLAPEITEKIRHFKDEGRAMPSGNPIDDSLYNHVLALYSIAGLAGDEGKIAVLRNMSLIPYSGVERSTFKAWAELDDLNDINALVDSGWLTLTDVFCKKIISMHAVISDAVFMQTNPDVENCTQFLYSITENMIVGTSGNPADKIHMIAYGEFVLKRIQQETELLGAIAYQTGYLLYFTANYAKALEWYQKTLAIREKVLGKEHLVTIATYNNIAGVYNSQGDYTKALELHQNALAIQEKVLGKDHQDTATTYSNIAGVYHHQGDNVKALEWYQKALAIKEEVLGKRHPDTAIVYNNIALIYDSLGDYTKALEEFQKALAIRENNLGKDHLDTANTYNNIAGVYHHQGDYAKALEWYQSALAIEEKIFGKNHPDTATTCNNIAVVYHSQGDYAKALEWYQNALAIFEKVLGKEHPSTATIYNNIAVIYYRQGDYAKALEWYLKTLMIQEKVLGKEHPDTAITCNNIAGVHDSQGDYAKALEWCRKALAIKEKVLGKEHPSTATTYINIAFVYYRQGDYAEALEWFYMALMIRVKIFGKDHPFTQTVRDNIAKAQKHLDDQHR